MSATNLTPFAFDENLVRMLFDEEGNPWFVAKDVARALGYPESSLSQLNNLLRNVPEEWKGHNQIMTPGGEQQVVTLSEQGLYFFLGRSDKPKALPFQKWLAGEVLPSLRKTGAYAVDGSHENTESLDAKERRVFGRELLETARGFSPRIRDRGLDYALQIARLCGVGKREDLRELYAECCELISGSSASGAGATEPFAASGRDEWNIGRFIREACEHDPGYRISSEKLWKAYARWMAATFGPHEFVPSNKRFSNEIIRLGVRVLRRRPTTLFVGVLPLAVCR